MCCSSGSNTATTTSSTSVPSWLSAAGQDAVSRAQTISNKPYEAFTGNTVAGLSPLQTEAMGVAGQTRDNYDASNRMATADAYMRGFAESPAGQIDGNWFMQNRTSLDPNSFGSVADTLDARGGDPFKSVTDYMNPFLSGVLDPTIRRIREQGDYARQSIDAQATGANAFGDARHGIEMGKQRDDEQRLVGDTTANLMNQGFNTANQMREAAINRFTQGLTGDIGRDVNVATADANLREAGLSRAYGAQDTNARLREAALQRLLGGGQALAGLDSTAIQQGTQLSNLLAGMGNLEQTQEQKVLSDEYQRFLERRDYPSASLNVLLNAIRGQPNQSTTTQVATTPKPANNAGLSLLGGLLGGFM